MPYKIAGIDVHKRMLHVVVSDVEVDGEYDFTRRVFGSLPEALRSAILAANELGAGHLHPRYLLGDPSQDRRLLVSNGNCFCLVPGFCVRIDSSPFLIPPPLLAARPVFLPGLMMSSVRIC